jgi:hypothetical protein
VVLWDNTAAIGMVAKNLLSLGSENSDLKRSDPSIRSV